jgi:hypothetical protein
VGDVFDLKSAVKEIAFHLDISYKEGLGMAMKFFLENPDDEDDDAANPLTELLRLWDQLEADDKSNELHRVCDDC